MRPSSDRGPWRRDTHRVTWRWRGGVRLLAGVVAAGFCVVAWASPAAAKFWPFELRVSAERFEAGQAIDLVATVDRAFADEAANSPEVTPAVGLYRSSDLPESGDEGPGAASPVADVSFVPEGDGVFRARLSIDEPGSYQLVSMNVWNYDLAGYPEPIALTVVEPRTPESQAGAAWLAVGVAVVVASGLVTLVRRRRLSHI